MILGADVQEAAVQAPPHDIETSPPTSKGYQLRVGSSSMLNELILLVLGLLVLLVAIKYGFLQVLAIVLAIVALVPFGTSVYLYFSNRPLITYQLANKTRTKDGNKFVYQAWLGLQAQKGRVLLDGVYVGMHEPGMSMIIPRDRLETLEESTFGAAIRLDARATPFFPKTGYVYTLRFESELEKAHVPLELFVDTRVDPAKLGFFSIFQPGHTYRFTAKINADFANPDRQEGELASAY